MNCLMITIRKGTGSFQKKKQTILCDLTTWIQNDFNFNEVVTNVWENEPYMK